MPLTLLPALPVSKSYLHLWKMSLIFQISHPSQKSMFSNALSLSKKNPICQIFHQKTFQKVLMEIEEMADVFLNSSNFAKQTCLTLLPPSGDALNLKALINLSEVIWTSQLSYEILRFSLERKFDKTNFISPERIPPISPHLLGLKVLAWEICSMKWGFAHKVIVKSQRQFMYGLNFHGSCHLVKECEKII